MAVAYDATSNAHTGTNSSTGDFSWTHTPTGTPRGVLVFIVLNAEAIDEIAGVTYGGVAMTEVPLSPLLHATGSEDATLFGYFLGASVPTGAQTVQVTTSGSTRAKTAQAITVTASADVMIDDTTTLETGSGSNPAVSLDVTADAAIFAVLHSGQLSGSVSPDGNSTELREATFTGTFTYSYVRRTSNSGGAGSFSVGWTAGTDEQAVLGVAIKESPAGSATASARPQTTTSGQKDVASSASSSAPTHVVASGFGPAESHSGSATCTASARVTTSGTDAKSGSASSSAAARTTASGSAFVPSDFTPRSAMML